eukprot:TRINITY_DN89089_c0_g1_i1.p1 TRINITY_DN89089_c0_g1~~TRINITY_DN89089_c0_g1_i1.p1  ORF type:complete len:141 (+),score=13.69 TRINITY_DN89089_c0_g1_i1:103-525(+)
MADTGQSAGQDESTTDRSKARRERRLCLKEQRERRASQAKNRRESFDREMRSTYTLERAMNEMLDASGLRTPCWCVFLGCHFDSRISCSISSLSSQPSSLMGHAVPSRLHLHVSAQASNQAAERPRSDYDEPVQRRSWTL